MTARPAARVVRDVALGAVGAWSMIVAHHAAAWMRVNPQSGPPWQRPPLAVPPADLVWDPVAVGLALIIGAAVALRRWAPTVTFAVTVVAGVGYVLNGGPLPWALPAPLITLLRLAAVRSGHRRWWWPAVITPVVVLAWAAAWHKPALGMLDPQTYLVVVAAVAVVVAPTLVRLARMERRRAAEQQHRDELERAASDERLRIARDIHDVVGHSLSMISLQAGVALHVMESDPEQVRASLRAIRDASRTSLEEIRQTVGAFRGSDAETTAALTPTADLAAVADLVDRVRAAGREVGLSRAGSTDAVPAAVQQAGYRIVQEAVTNAVRHAPDAAITVDLAVVDGVLRVAVVDDGAGAAHPVVIGNGLRGMIERVSAVGGVVDIGPEPGRGFGVHARLPLTTEAP